MNSILQKNSIKKSDNLPVKKVNILMVDDHPENLLALEAVLQSPNYHLVSATSGKEALKYMLQQDFAVILLDVQMPGLNGFETAELIKAREKTKHIPIIFITAINQDEEHVHKGYSVGAIDYIFKPFDPKTLQQKVEQFVKLHQNHEELMLQSHFEHEVELHDVNEKLERTRLNLYRTEALSQVISETIIDTIVTLDEKGYILSVNPAVQHMFGYDAEELIVEHVSKFFKTMKRNDETHSPSSIFSSIQEGVGRVIEAVALRKDSREFPVELQIGEARIEEQPIFVCTIRDITERKQIEEVKKQQFNQMEKMVERRTYELRQTNDKLQNEIAERNKIAEHLYISQERFRKIFESSPCLMAITSLNDDTYIDVNTTWINYTGYSYDEMKSKKINEIHFIEESKGDYIHFKETFRNKKVMYKTKHGETRSGLLSTEVIDILSEPCILVVITDITERMLLENEMSRLDRLNLIGEMAAGIAHEIRNPMTTVYGFLQVTRNERGEIPIEVVDLMIEELDRANSIITEFLNLAKNKVSMKKVQSLNSIIETLYPMVQAEALRTSKHVKLDLGTCPDIAVDQKEIRQLILNIGLNGLDAMSPGGMLTIKTYVEDKFIVLEIQDQGEGISSEALEKLGTPFFTTKEEGTGLGLAICYSVAERHDADIEIKTGSKGTSFFIRFKSSHV